MKGTGEDYKRKERKGLIHEMDKGKLLCLYRHLRWATY